MRIKRFTISDFKGINNTSIDVDDTTPGDVVTLVGLNESGKTTILEAISYFITEDVGTSALVGTVQSKGSLQEIVPKSKAAAFSGTIKIAASVIIESKDVDKIEKQLREIKSLTLDRDSFPNQIKVDNSFTFEDTRFKERMQYWSFIFKATRGDGEVQTFTGYADEAKELKDIWRFAISVIRDEMPTVSYFPTFLFDFPDRIYLEKKSTETESPINEYYKIVIQDVLDGLNEGITLDKHIVARVKHSREEHPALATFMSFFFKSNEKKLIEAVCQRIASEMTRVIFGAWAQVLGKPMPNKRVDVSWNLDNEKENAIYLEISIIDGSSTYLLSERSLGFRWFFSFLLFTQFRKSRQAGGSTIFMFDEPASNLHSRAQIRLLESFNRIAGDRTKIIYSTHSHYMINPFWLEKAYVVQNRGMDLEGDDDEQSYLAKDADICATKYKNFVSKAPSKTTYFQPILDALQIPTCPLERSSKGIVVEGKNDYYSLLYFMRGNGFCEANIFPGTGAGTLGPLISLFRGWQIDFAILLDDDKAGRTAKESYKTDFLLLDEEIVTIGDIEPNFKGRSIEFMYKSDVQAAIRKEFGDIHRVTKKQYGIFFQSLLSGSIEADIAETKAAFLPILNWLENRFAS